MILSPDMKRGKDRAFLWASPPGITPLRISPISRYKSLDRVCEILHIMSMADIRQSILDRMEEFGWTINHVSVLVRGRIPRRTVYAYLTGECDARTEVASVLMEVLGLTITSKPVERANKPRKERGA